MRALELGVGGKHRSGRTRKGSKWLREALIESAKAATRARETFLAAQYGRLQGRRGNAEVDGEAKKTVSLKAAGTTKVVVPDEVKKLLE